METNYANNPEKLRLQIILGELTNPQTKQLADYMGVSTRTIFNWKQEPGKIDIRHLFSLKEWLEIERDAVIPITYLLDKVQF
jgi:hypothetical protein